jgi:hypothetical protein
MFGQRMPNNGQNVVMVTGDIIDQHNSKTMPSNYFNQQHVYYLDKHHTAAK